jgi:16S rRNA (cytosine967-C5)-methyltransferase
VRANTLRVDREAVLAELSAAGAAAVPSRWARDGIVIGRGAARIRQLPAWHAGRLAFQGEASQLIAPLLGLAPGARVLDACAAPGGKAAHAAALLRGTGVVVALDSRPGGGRRIAAEAARLGATAVHALAGDARRPPVRGGFDAVLVDAPCSGLGTLRRHPELRWRRRPEDVPRLAALQEDILAGVAPLVRPGGVLVYAVCTLTRAENEDVVAHFRAAHPVFEVEDIDATGSAPAALATPEGFLRTLPHRHGLDGFFAARLRARS